MGDCPNPGLGLQEFSGLVLRAMGCKVQALRVLRGWVHSLRFVGGLGFRVS